MKMLTVICALCAENKCLQEIEKLTCYKLDSDTLSHVKLDSPK